MGKLSYPLKIRAHHLLCLLGFRRIGYSRQFVANMQKVAESTFSSHNALHIVDRCDAICSACPYRNDDECQKEEDSAQLFKRQDHEVANRLGVEIGSELTWQELLALISQNITSADILEVCRDCEWLKSGYCIDAIERLRQRTG